jgi:hypothetical protein
MPFYSPFEKSDEPVSDRFQPNELDAALGFLIITFQELEAIIRVAIAAELKVDPSAAAIVTVELPFKKLVHVLGALIRNGLSGDSSDIAKEKLGRWQELAGQCFFIEDMRNRFMHSYWPITHLGGSEALRVKLTVRKEGLREQRESITAGDLLDVTTHAMYIMTMIEELLDLAFGAADNI